MGNRRAGEHLLVPREPKVPRGQDPAGTCRQSFKESGCQEGAGQGFTEGREEGCREATAESRRASACYSGGDRVALPSRRDAPLWRNAVVTASG